MTVACGKVLDIHPWKLTAAGTAPDFHRIPFSGAARRTTCVRHKDTSYLDGSSIFTTASLGDFLTQARNPRIHPPFLHPAAGPANAAHGRRRQKPGRRAQGFSAR